LDAAALVSFLNLSCGFDWRMAIIVGSFFVSVAWETRGCSWAIMLSRRCSGMVLFGDPVLISS
jgi:hypothetical protein